MESSQANSGGRSQGRVKDKLLFCKTKEVGQGRAGTDFKEEAGKVVKEYLTLEQGVRMDADARVIRDYSWDGRARSDIAEEA